ncbi:MAG: hypothetical protein U5L96_21750 [Owenweeksia sp.]|nr:hypothetical protein [Owenweeksia sp.]
MPPAQSITPILSVVIYALVSLFAGAFLWQIKRIFKAFLENSAIPELLPIGGFALPFIGFSMLSYKLPHYLYVLFPLAAILTAHWWEHTWRKIPGQRWRIIATASQFIVWLALAGVCYFVFFKFFSGAAWWQWLTCLLLLLGALPFTLLGYRHKYRLITASVLGSVALNYCLNAWLFPNWLNYQAGERLIDQIENRRIPKSSIYPYHFYSYSFHYHMGYTEVPDIDDAKIEEALKENQTIYLVTRDPYLQDVRSDFESDIIFQMSSHHMKGLSMKFLNPDTRMETLNQVYLVKIMAPKHESP